jgi:hypothetical protein
MPDVLASSSSLIVRGSIFGTLLGSVSSLPPAIRDRLGLADSTPAILRRPPKKDQRDPRSKFPRLNRRPRNGHPKSATNPTPESKQLVGGFSANPGPKNLAPFRIWPLDSEHATSSIHAYQRARRDLRGASDKSWTWLRPRSVSCLLPTAYCLLPTAYCLLPTAYCLLPIILLPPERGNYVAENRVSRQKDDATKLWRQNSATKPYAQRRRRKFNETKTFQPRLRS